MKSGKNYFVCNRSLFKNPLWYAEKFTKGQAWLDLFGNANHSDGWFEKNGQRVDIKRGQTGRSIESLAGDWKWSRNKVKRFLKRLKDEHMIDHETNHLTSVITVCNYDKFQFDDKNSEPPNELPDEPSLEPPDEPQTKKKEKRIKKEVILKPENVTDQTWNDFLTHRKNKKANVTQTVLNGFIKQAGLAGYTLEDAFKESIERGWAGFKAEWVNKDKKLSVTDHNQQYFQNLKQDIQENANRPGEIEILHDNDNW